MNRATAPASTGVDNWNTVVALNIRHYRVLNGWSQTELARRFDNATGQQHSQAAMAAMEVITNGVARRRFDANEIRIFARIFDVDELDLMTPTTPTSASDDALLGDAAGAAFIDQVLAHRVQPTGYQARWAQRRYRHGDRSPAVIARLVDTAGALLRQHRGESEPSN